MQSHANSVSALGQGIASKSGSRPKLRMAEFEEEEIR